MGPEDEDVAGGRAAAEAVGVGPPGPAGTSRSPHEAGLGLRPPEPRGHVCCWRSLVVPAQSGSLPREPPGLKDHTVPRQEDTQRPRSTGINTACVSATVRVTVMGEGLLTRWKVP